MAHKEETLDPEDWEQSRAIAHQMVDDAIDYLQTVRDRPVWQDMPDDVKSQFSKPLPEEPTDLNQVYKGCLENMMPYPMGNIHPRFWMWYMGSSNFTGAMGDFMAAIVGSNRRDHVAPSGKRHCRYFRYNPSRRTLLASGDKQLSNPAKRS